MPIDAILNARKTRLVGLPYSDSDVLFDLESDVLSDAIAGGKFFNLVIYDRTQGDAADARAAGRMEIVRVDPANIGVSPPQISVTRAQEGTTAIAFDTDGIWEVIMAPTKGLFDQILAEIDIAKDSGIIAVDETVTYQVGSGGDYADINSALEDLTENYHTIYNPAGVEVVLNLVSGYTMSEQVLVTGMDLSWIRITGTDASTTIDRSALTTEFFDGFPAFGAYRAFLPVIDQLFDMDTSGTATERHGMLCYNCSQGVITSGSGFINVGGRGCFAVGSSKISADGGVFDGAGDRGIHAERSSSIDANNASADDCALFGIQATRGSNINARFASATGAGNDGIFANNGSTVCARQATTSGGNNGISVGTGGVIAANDATGDISQTANTITSSGIIFQ